MRRYQRQRLLPQIGELGQEFLAQSKVLVVGAGGLGHPAIQYLSAMGIGKIGIVDGDTVQESNLHRQVLFDIHDIGKNKSDCLVNKLALKENHVQFESHPFYLDKSMALQLFDEYDVIVDGTDNFASKLLINDVCCYFSKPMIYGAISQFEGQISVFWRGHGSCYRCLVPDMPKSNIQNCAEAGVIGALPGAIGAMQSIETLKVLMNIFDSKNQLVPLVGKIHYIDFLTNESRVLKLSTRASCRCQLDNFSQDKISDYTMSICGLVSLVHLLDVREISEWEEFNIPGVVNWPLSKIEAGELPIYLSSEKRTLICKSGIRAERALKILKASGFEQFTYTKEDICGYQNRKI